MSARELDAAGIKGANLRASYERCRKLNSEHGKTYYLATLLLPPAKRPFVHALYGFARHADDIVDAVNAEPVTRRRAALAALGQQLATGRERGSSTDPICAAVLDTARRWQIPDDYFSAFLESMAMDLEVSSYATYQDLERYVYGSAAVIGLQMVHLLEPTSDEAFGYAADLGTAFQLANFIRDVGEDLNRRRIYLPLDELAAFGVTPESLRTRLVTPELKAALAFQIDRVRKLDQRSRAGIKMLSPDSQPCIEAARVLYCAIADEVERNDYEVFTKRAQVSLIRRLAIATPAWRQARRARRRSSLDPQPAPNHPQHERQQHQREAE